MNIYQCFLDSGVPVEKLCPSVVVDFFKSHNETGSSCNLGSVPIDLKATPLRDEHTMAAVVNYCMKDSEYVLDNIQGLPLLLCADGQIRTFTIHEPVYLTEYTDLLPDCSSMFVHNALAKSAFCSIRPEDHPVFQRFDVPEFASLLPNVMSEV